MLQKIDIRWRQFIRTKIDEAAVRFSMPQNQT